MIDWINNSCFIIFRVLFITADTFNVNLISGFALNTAKDLIDEGAKTNQPYFFNFNVHGKLNIQKDLSFW